MKTKEELNAIKKEAEEVSKELRALSEEELEQIVGGNKRVTEISNVSIAQGESGLLDW